ncbi:hypothetical protein [Bradyrhizobium sp. SZCCHNPS1003]|uniref:hypothetical protein n=1 Tax=Bradyrhizobium sp. SZCCHNPS1003 TaxID=3057330 RepID=UPI0028E89D61|nr:hypothetical protein [Bradyrhizobium sp. SZCCHNPS1003]
MSWEVEKYHVVPINDYRDHSTDSDKPCWCNPTEECGVFVHHSMDRRELYEMGIRRLS